MLLRRTAARLALALTVSLGVAGVSGGLAASPGAGAGPITAQVTAQVTALVTAPITPVDDERGTWTVSEVSPGHWQVQWRSPQRLPLTSDHPVIAKAAGAQEQVGPTSLAADGRTVTAVVVAETAPDPDLLDVELSGDRLDVSGRDRVTAAGTTSAPALVPTATDPGVRGPYAVVSSDYRLDPVKIAPMAEPIEMVGHVVEPAATAATGLRPLVLFLHGRHSYCYDPESGADGFDWPCTGKFKEIPSHLGYDYIQRLLASQGYATVSVRVNGINAQDWILPDGGAQARARIVQRHLDHWAAIADAHQVDLSQVVLVGHSRGGEGVDRASIRIPLSAPYRIVGQVLLAPTDFGNQTAPYVPTVTVLPYCDGDVIDLQGQRFTDTARDLFGDDTSLKSSVLVMGANHNFFNTEWTPGVAAAPAWDDWWGDKDAACGNATDARLTAAEQRAVGKAYVAGAVQLFTPGFSGGDTLQMYDGSPVLPPSAGDAVVLSHALGGGRVLRRPGQAVGLSLAHGARTQFCRGASEARIGQTDVCGRFAHNIYSVPHWPTLAERVPLRRELEMSWTTDGAVGGLIFDRPLDVSAGRLDLRTIVDPALGGVRLRVRLTDTAGATAVVVPLGGGRLPALLRSPQLSKHWAQTLSVELTDPAVAGAIDLAHVKEVELLGDSADGRIWVLDVAAVPTTLAPVPEQRLPVISLGRVVQDEGDETVGYGEVPFRISGEVTQPASLVVVAGSGLSPGNMVRSVVDLAPGQTSGTIPVSYRAGTADDYWSTPYTVLAWPLHGAMTDAYNGRLTVRDDDPPPTLAVTPLASPVAEGRAARFELKLSEVSHRFIAVTVKIVRGNGEVLRSGDVPRAWLTGRAHKAGTRRTPLYLRDVREGLYLEPGDRSVVFSVPTRRDGRHEGKESVTIRLVYGGKVVTRTVWVTSS